MRAHDTAPGRHIEVKHLLHDGPLVQIGAQPNAIALPIAPRPRRFVRRRRAGNFLQELAVSLAEQTTLRDHLGQAFKLFSSYRRLDIGHAVVVTDRQIGFENNFF